MNLKGEELIMRNFIDTFKAVTGSEFTEFLIALLNKGVIEKTDSYLNEANHLRFETKVEPLYKFNGSPSDGGNGSHMYDEGTGECILILDGSKFKNIDIELLNTNSEYSSGDFIKFFEAIDVIKDR